MILWPVEAVAVGGFVPPAITIHTANASARLKMLLGSVASNGWRQGRELRRVGRLGWFSGGTGRGGGRFEGTGPV